MQIVDLQARSFGCKAEIDWMEAQQPYYPPLVNDEAAYHFAVNVGQQYVQQSGNVSSKDCFQCAAVQSVMHLS